MMEQVTVLGAGLAGSEAAWQLAKRGIPVRLVEMKPEKSSPAHHTPWMAELVCSNSLALRPSDQCGGVAQGRNAPDGFAHHAGGGSGAGSRRRRLGCGPGAFLRLCYQNAGGASAGDGGPPGSCRNSRGSSHRGHRAPYFPGAGGSNRRLPGLETLNFYDAAAPIVTAESLNMEKIFRQSRYDRGEDYLNCPMTEEEYQRFVDALLTAEMAPIHGLRRARCLKAACPWNPWPGRDAWCWLSAP